MYEVLCSLGILTDFQDYRPILAGTFPIDIAIETNDLDIYSGKLLRQYYGYLSCFSFSPFQIKGKKR